MFDSRSSGQVTMPVSDSQAWYEWGSPRQWILTDVRISRRSGEMHLEFTTHSEFASPEDRRELVHGSRRFWLTMMERSVPREFRRPIPRHLRRSDSRSISRSPGQSSRQPYLHPADHQRRSRRDVHEDSRSMSDSRWSCTSELREGRSPQAAGDQ